MPMRLKRVTPVVEDNFGVCLWQMPDGAFLGDDEGRFLSMGGYLNDVMVESKMQTAAIYYLGAEAAEGRPVWMPGSRQVSDMEAEAQLENLIEGRTPDEAESFRRLNRKGLL